MVKKIVSIATAFLMLCCMIPFGAFADDVLDVCPKCGERTYSTWRDLSVEVADALGMPLSIKAKSCSNCGYAYYDWNLFGVTGYKDYANGGTSLIIDYLREWIDKTFGKNATATKAPSGIGRKDLPGYTDDNGTPSVSSDGSFCLYAYPDYYYYSNSKITPVDYGRILFDYGYQDMQKDSFSATNTSSSTRYFRLSTDNNNYCAKWSFVAPVSGLYFVSSGKIVSSSFNYDGRTYKSLTLKSNYSKKLTAGSSSDVCKTGSNLDYVSFPVGAGKSDKVALYPIKVSYIPDTTTINQQTNITINNNTWNGNIYTDNSTNLTYIYPEYTTINENNETVTNISTNPIIYNNTTNQYYTYDTVTNNYYYITYEEPSPTPTPAPTWTPGGDSGGGNSGSSDSGWNPFKWLTDLLKDIVESILKGLWKLLTSIFGFILWLLSLLFKLFPWMPNSGILALCAGVVVVTVIRIIKFITGR